MYVFKTASLFYYLATPSDKVHIQRYLHPSLCPYILPKKIISKVMKNAFYFIQKALFVLEIFNFLFFPSFPHFSDLKAQIKLEYL